MSYPKAGVIQGTALDRGTGLPLRNVWVAATAKSPHGDVIEKVATVSKQGAFLIEWPPSDSSDLSATWEQLKELKVQLRNESGEVLTEDQMPFNSWRTHHTIIDLLVTSAELMLPLAVRDILENALLVIKSQVETLDTATLEEALYLSENDWFDPKDKSRILAAFPAIVEATEDRQVEGGINQIIRAYLHHRGAHDAAVQRIEHDIPNEQQPRLFYTEHFEIRYTVQTQNRNSVDPELPTHDYEFVPPGWEAVGWIRRDVADLHLDNQKISPTVVQEVGLLAEHALKQWTHSPFGFPNPIPNSERMEIRLLFLPIRSGETSPRWNHFDIHCKNKTDKNSFTVAHELFHRIQYLYNKGVQQIGTEGAVREGGARFAVDCIYGSLNMWVHSATPHFNSPHLASLLEANDRNPLRPYAYAGGIVWKYIAEQHGERTCTGELRSCGAETYQLVLEESATDAGKFDYTVDAIRNARNKMSGPGTFDNFQYCGNYLLSSEMTWGNFLVAKYLHRKMGANAALKRDKRFDYEEDNDNGSSLSMDTLLHNRSISFRSEFTLGKEVPILEHPRLVPWAAYYYKFAVPQGYQGVVEFEVSASPGTSNPFFQVTKLNRTDTFEIFRADGSAFRKRINANGVKELVLITATRDASAGFEIEVSEVEKSIDVMVTRANCEVGKEFELNPNTHPWSWRSPDLIIDNDGDDQPGALLSNAENALKIRMRNRGNVPTSADISVVFLCQLSENPPDPNMWQNVVDGAGAIQQLVGLQLDANDDGAWYSIQWKPSGEATGNLNWWIKAEIVASDDVNTDNKHVIAVVG